MNILRAFLLAAIGIGGGALWLGSASSEAAPPGGGGGGGCASCVGQVCKTGNVDSTCKSGFDGKYRWCASSSGCARV